MEMMGTLCMFGFWYDFLKLDFFIVEPVCSFFLCCLSFLCCLYSEYNSHDTTHPFKCAIQGCLVYSQGCAPTSFVLLSP